MAVNTSRILIETIVRKTLKELETAPERNIRNLVDMALNFSKGRFQKNFFQITQQMLSDENSAYYQLVRDIASHVEHERLLQFGMNIGYNSCTLGAKKIREIEAAQGFNIPWALFLELDEGIFLAHQQAYDSLIRQGNELGIYTWMISSNRYPMELFQMLKEHPDCAFALLCGVSTVDEEMMDALYDLPHVMLCVGMSENTASICSKLRKRKMLYAVHQVCSSDDMPEVLSDNLLYDMQSLNALFTLLMPDPHCSAEERALLYQYVLDKRKGQQFQTILMDMFEDMLNIDTIISEGSCSAWLKADGSFYAPASEPLADTWNMFSSPLDTIFANILKKKV